MKKIIYLLLLITTSSYNYSQQLDKPTQKDNTIKPDVSVNNSWKINLSTTYVTQHYWRGIGRGGLFGKAPSLESQLTFSHRNLTLGVFGGASFDNIYKTLMPFVIYKVTPEFSVAVQDIYSPGTHFWDSNPTNFDIYTSKHFVDYYMVYRFKNIPLQLKWTTIFLGKDPNANGDRNYSSYAEVSTGMKVDQWQLDAYIGGTPWKGLYAKEAGISNLEGKIQYNFMVNKNTPFPVFIKVAHNPIAKTEHFIAGCTINLGLK